MGLSETEKMLIHGLKLFPVSKGKSMLILAMLENEEQQNEMMEYMVSHTKATEDELLEQARMIAE